MLPSGKDKDESLARRRPVRAAFGFGFALLTFQLLAWAQPQNASEDQVKAAYLVNFAKLAAWPSPLPDSPTPLTIGISGGDEDFLAVVGGVIAGKIVGIHPLIVKPVSSEQEMKSCQIVFFRASGRKHTQTAIQGMAQAGVLLVGEDDTFLWQGGMINLVRDHGSIRFEVES